MHGVRVLQAVAVEQTPFFFNYPDGFPATILFDGTLLISSPQVLAEVRDFFGCPTLPAAEIETDGAHWETRIHQVCPPEGLEGPRTRPGNPVCGPAEFVEAVLTISDRRHACGRLSRATFPYSPASDTSIPRRGPAVWRHAV